MTIASMKALLERAVRNRYAIGYFESWDQYSLEGAMEAAEEAQAPAILGFGAAVTRQEWLDDRGVERLAWLARDLAEHSGVPTAVLFNEARSVAQMARAMAAGCNAVMLDTSDLPYEDNVAITRQVVAMAHAVGATVEAELGHLPDDTEPQGRRASFTNPSEAARFVEHTGVDALAVSVGNTHNVITGEVAVDLALLSDIRRATGAPLVIHGGTGFPRASVAGAVACGVAKFNVGTRLKRGFLAAVADALPDPMQVREIHPFVGSRGADDVLARGKERLKREIREYIELYGAAGQAAAESR